MASTGLLSGTGTELPAVRVFELLNGREYAVFFAAREDELPNENVGRELRALARRSSERGHTRRRGHHERGRHIRPHRRGCLGSRSPGTRCHHLLSASPKRQRPSRR